ncbi:MAG: DUF169 domain-containing protein [Dehalococcoidia bacterium]|nr:DUF169 domain-containing protein [Dehalococcoidia bacterium]
MYVLSDYCRVGQELYERLHLPTYPVAIKYIKGVGEIPEGVKRPSKMGQKWSPCQAFTYARRWGWTAALTIDDSFCTTIAALHGWVDLPDEVILQSQLFQALHRNEEAEKKRLQHDRDSIGKENLLRLKQYRGMITAPAHKMPVMPDSVLVFGNAEHITHIIQALTYDGENYPVSSFEGLGETCYKGGLVPFITGVPQVVIPGMGDRSFSGVYDYEVAIGMPARLLPVTVDNLFKSGGKLNMGNPIKTLLPMGITENITPGFKYMRGKIDEHRA